MAATATTDHYPGCLRADAPRHAASGTMFGTNFDANTVYLNADSHIHILDQKGVQMKRAIMMTQSTVPYNISAMH